MANEKKKNTNKVDKNDSGQSKNSSKKQKRIPPLSETEKYILKTVRGQDEQVRSIVTSTYRALMFRGIKTNVLIVGRSGTGKTETLKQLAKKLNRPYVIEDANEFTQEGYYGRDVTEIIYDLIDAAKGNVESAKNGIIIIDEIDKKAGCDMTERDISGTGVLNSLLKLIEGKNMRISATDEMYIEDDVKVDEFGLETFLFNTENLIVFFAGAFSGIDKIRKNRTNVRTLGFCDKPNQAGQNNKTAKFIKKDFIEYGLPEEFVGRIDTIVEMNELTEDALVDILKHSQKSILKAYVSELKKHGIKVKYTTQIVQAFARKAKSIDTGARELSNVVNYAFEKILHEIMSNPEEEYTECILLDGIEEDNTRYTLK